MTATLIDGVNTSTIQCQFIGDSNAAGCIVILTTINGQKVYYNLTKNRSTNSTAIAVTLEHPPPCYSGVEAVDIESNGSFGSLAIPGHIIVNPSWALCTPASLPGRFVRPTEELLITFYFSSQTQFIRNCVGSLDDSCDISGSCHNIIIVCCDHCNCLWLQI